MLPQMTQQYLGRAPRHEERSCALILFRGFKWEEGSHEGAGRKHCGRAGNRNTALGILSFIQCSTACCLRAHWQGSCLTLGWFVLGQLNNSKSVQQS